MNDSLLLNCDDTRFFVFDAEGKCLTFNSESCSTSMSLLFTKIAEPGLNGLVDLVVDKIN